MGAQVQNLVGVGAVNRQPAHLFKHQIMPQLQDSVNEGIEEPPGLVR